MPKKTALFPKFVTLGVIVVVSMGVGWWFANRSNQASEFETGDQAQSVDGSEKRAIHLYFGDAQGRFLVSEQRVIDAPYDNAALGRQLITLLARGPERGRTRTLPAEAQVSAFYITEDGRAFVDFAEGSFANHPGGVGTELLSIYSVVNTLVLNVETIRSVKFLIGGHEAATLAGHADLLAPYAVDMLWVR